jgi:glycerol-3-phosphate O-acyltransferase
MLSSVELPLWFVVILGTLSSVWVLDRLCAPVVRWMLEQRRLRKIDSLNRSLRLTIQPFKLAKRRVLVDRLLAEPEILHAIDEAAKTENAPREKLFKTARRYAHEIIPAFSAAMYFRVGTRIARRISESMYRVRLGYTNNEAMKAIDPNASVVFVINHRSNMDYVLVTYLASASSALSYAVGEWAQIWLLRDLLRSMGAYFVRRDSRNPLYRKVLSRYVHTATAAGVVQAVFPEGGLSRDGRLRPPKLGLISYMVAGFDPKAAKDILFIPVGVNYDRVLEDRNLTAAANLAPGQEPRFKFNPAILIKGLAKTTWRALRGRYYRNGYACVSFGEPISLRAYLADEGIDFRILPDDRRTAAIEKLGLHLMDHVGRVVPVLPVSLVATVLLEAGGTPLTEFELKGRVYDLMARLEQANAHIHIPRADRSYAIDVGMRMLLMRRLVVADKGVFTAHPGETHILRYYANSIAHLHKGVAVAVRPARALPPEYAPVHRSAAAANA